MAGPQKFHLHVRFFDWNGEADGSLRSKEPEQPIDPPEHRENHCGGCSYWIQDNSSSGLMPFYDADNSVMFLAGKGDGNIRYYEIVDTDPYIHYLNEFKSKDPQSGKLQEFVLSHLFSGMAALPKQVNDVMKCEIMVRSMTSLC